MALLSTAPAVLTNNAEVSPSRYSTAHPSSLRQASVRSTAARRSYKLHCTDDQIWQLRARKYTSRCARKWRAIFVQLDNECENGVSWNRWCVHSVLGFINVTHGMDTARCNPTEIKITSLSPRLRAEVQNVHEDGRCHQSLNAAAGNL